MAPPQLIHHAKQRRKAELSLSSFFPLSSLYSSLPPAPSLSPSLNLSLSVSLSLSFPSKPHAVSLSPGTYHSTGCILCFCFVDRNSRSIPAVQVHADSQRLFFFFLSHKIFLSVHDVKLLNFNAAFPLPLFPLSHSRTHIDVHTHIYMEFCTSILVVQLLFIGLKIMGIKSSQFSN